MSTFAQVEEAERYFATVAITDRDIALAEYGAAALRCNDDERAITIANGLLIAGLAAMQPLLSPVLETLLSLDDSGANLPLAAFVIGWAFITSVISSYVCDLRRAYVFSARKIIVIRRLLGLSFGHFALVLPTWRLEGADQPFAIKLFPGWRPAAAYSLYATVFLSASVLWLATMSALPHTSWATQDPWIVSTAASLVWAAYWLFAMRRKLYDTHEGVLLSLARCLAWVCKVRLVADIHQTLYRGDVAPCS